jgi:hypothetical protein
MEQDFDEWWRAYPKKVAKGDARRAWMQTQRIRPDMKTMLNALEAAKKSAQWRKASGDFIPHPATYLRGERWEDEHEVALGDQVTTQSGEIIDWWQSSVGIEKKGAELGISLSDFDNFPSFKNAVFQAARPELRVA